MEFNINDDVFVKLTDFGREELKRQHEKLYSSIPSPLRTDKFELPKEDAEGWSKWSMWVLMNAFGPLLHNGGKVPFETEILIEE